MMKEDPRYDIDVVAPSAGFGVAAEVLDHEKDDRFLTCWCVMGLTTQAWSVKPIEKMMSYSMMELSVVDLILL